MAFLVVVLAKQHPRKNELQNNHSFIFENTEHLKNLTNIFTLPTSEFIPYIPSPTLKKRLSFPKYMPRLKKILVHSP